jgi:precorrin-3B synthase
MRSEAAAPEIRGWCPGALRPMPSGDGWLVRIRPPGGVLTPAQAAGIAKAARAHGNGTIDLSSRANLQLRGIREAAHPALIADLRAHGLIDPDIETETLRNLIITPFHMTVGHPPTPTLPHGGGREVAFPTGSAPPISAPDSIATLARAMTAILAWLPRLPGKFGFALDTGPRPVLTCASADIRLERDAKGALILRPDGHPFGRLVTDLSADIGHLVTWFLDTGGMADGRGRMASHLARATLPAGFTTRPARPLLPPGPGLHPEGALVAFAFGQMQAETLTALASLGHDLRLTPWRMLLIAGMRALPDLPGLIAAPDDPLLRVTACTGAPGCAQALGPTRALARALAPQVTEHLHISGCAKGCAHPGPAPLTLVATATGYDLIRNATAAGAPDRTNIAPHMIADALKDPHAPPL